MSHALPATVEQTGATTLGDRGASYLRTVVPVIWGTLIAQLLAWATPHLPGDLAAALADWLSGEQAIAVVSAAVIAAWYVVWRRLEPLLPHALTRLVLGSAAAPTYLKVSEVTDDGTAVLTTLTAATADVIPAATPEQIVAGQDPTLDYADVDDDGAVTITPGQASAV